MATAIMAAHTIPPLIPSSSSSIKTRRQINSKSRSISSSSLYHHVKFISLTLSAIPSKKRNQHVTTASLSSSPQQTADEFSTKLYISGLSFRTTQQSLTNAFQDFGQLVEVNLVMDKIANRPRGFAFVRYASEEESKKAIEGMHGKFLDGRVIFVEVAKPRSELHRDFKESPRRY